eukprot:SAG11_NODE_19193_length_472_cov_0.892761_1_plen_32_part_01
MYRYHTSIFGKLPQKFTWYRRWYLVGVPTTVK